jgi:hypothetical protein
VQEVRLSCGQDVEIAPDLTGNQRHDLRACGTLKHDNNGAVRAPHFWSIA